MKEEFSKAIKPKVIGTIWHQCKYWRVTVTEALYWWFKTQVLNNVGCTTAFTDHNEKVLYLSNYPLIKFPSTSQLSYTALYIALYLFHKFSYHHKIFGTTCVHSMTWEHGHDNQII